VDAWDGNVEEPESMATDSIYFSDPIEYRAPATINQLARRLHSAGCEIAILTAGWTGHAVIAAHPLVDLSLDMNGNHCELSRRTGSRCMSGVQAGSSLPAASMREGLGLLCDEMESMCADHGPTTPPEGVGWIGYITYDAGRQLEWPADGRTDNLARFRCYRNYYIYIGSGCWQLVTGYTATPVDDSAMEEMKSHLTAAAREAPLPPAVITGLQWPDGQDYMAAVRRAQQYIADGDIYQINISRRWNGHATDPLALWASMFSASPGRYSAYIGGSRRAVCSTSPELFLARHGDALTTCPIKGTRPRDERDPLQDRLSSEHLLQSPKERAELAMILDLLRNDLGRVCQIGSVHIVAERQLECLPSVWQTYATVRGESRRSWGDILGGMLPGGSITGVPKIRAMNIIDELEPYARGLYCGNIGWMRNGVGSFNIAIRTAIWEDDRFAYHAGAGIVTDSDAAQEYDEICAKARVITSLVKAQNKA